jgi:hypothetical protein
MGKRGPKKRPDQKRERNGRASRQPAVVAERNLLDLDAEQRDMLSVGLTARERVLHVKPSQSRDQMAGSVIGRWCLQRIVTQAQYDAAMAFLESNTRNLLAIDAPPLPGAVDLNRTHGRPVGLENAPQLRKWRAAHKAALDAIQAKQNEIRLQGNLYGALYAVVIRDVDLEHMAGDVRTALNALVRHYGLEARAAA